MALSPIFQRKPFKSNEKRGTGALSRFTAKQLPSSTVLKEKVVSEQLKNIYSDRDGRVHDLTRLERGKGFSWLKATVILVVLAALGLGGWLGVQAFYREGAIRFGEEQMELTIDAPKTAAAGEIVTLTMHMSNRSTVSVGQLDLLMQYPTGFEVIQSSPTPQAPDSRQWKLSDLAAGASTDLIVKGKFWAQPPANQEVRASLVFAPEHLRASFRAQAVSTVAIDRSMVSVAVKSPDRLSLGQQGKWEVDVMNTSSDPISDISIGLILPQQFLAERTTPPVAMTSGIEWTNLSLPAGNTQSLVFEGTFVDISSAGAPNNSPTADAKEFRVRTYHGSSVDRQLIGEIPVNSVVTQNAFSVRMRVNDSLSQVTVTPPTTVHAAVDVINHGSDPVSDVTVLMHLNSNQQIVNLVDLSQITGKSAPTIDGNTLRWDKTTLDRLAFIRGGDTVTASIDIPIRPQAQGSLEIAADASYPEKGTPKSVTSNSTTVSFATKINGSIAARYYTDDNLAFGTGPIPPRVGSTTTLALLATITKPTGSYQAVEFSFPLESGVQFVRASPSTGTVRFDAFTRRVIWNVPTFPDAITSLNADIRVSITPKQSDVGTVLRLANSATLKATDTQSAALVERVIPLNVTTDLEGDPQVEGRGTVVVE